MTEDPRNAALSQLAYQLKQDIEPYSQALMIALRPYSPEALGYRDSEGLEELKGNPDQYRGALFLRNTLHGTVDPFAQACIILKGKGKYMNVAPEKRLGMAVNLLNTIDITDVSIERYMATDPILVEGKFSDGYADRFAPSDAILSEAIYNFRSAVYHALDKVRSTQLPTAPIQSAAAGF